MGWRRSYINQGLRTPQKKRKMNTILKFKIGRGGNFYNPGHLSFEGVTKGISHTSEFNSLFPPMINEEEEDRSPDAEWTDGSGNSVELTNAMVDSGIGRINMDNDYDTVYTIFAKDCSEEESNRVFKQAQEFNGKYYHQYGLDEIIDGVAQSTIKMAAENGLLADLYEHMRYGGNEAAWLLENQEEE
jgi:hypothetical protein